MSDPDEEEVRTCSNCGREIFNMPGEGIAGDEKLCSDCWDGDGEFCSGELIDELVRRLRAAAAIALRRV